MNRAMVAGAVVLMLMSLACVTVTVFYMVRGDFGFSGAGFWEMAAFHPATMIAAVFLLAKARPAVEPASAATEAATPQATPDEEETP